MQKSTNNKDMARIVFKNGSTMQVPQEVLAVLHERVMQQAGGAKKWQGFTNEHGIVLYLINMDEICSIETEKEL